MCDRAREHRHCPPADNLLRHVFPAVFYPPIGMVHRAWSAIDRLNALNTAAHTGSRKGQHLQLGIVAATLTQMTARANVSCHRVQPVGPAGDTRRSRNIVGYRGTSSSMRICAVCVCACVRVSALSPWCSAPCPRGTALSYGAACTVVLPFSLQLELRREIVFLLCKNDRASCWEGWSTTTFCFSTFQGTLEVRHGAQLAAAELRQTMCGAVSFAARAAARPLHSAAGCRGDHRLGHRRQSNLPPTVV